MSELEKYKSIYSQIKDLQPEDTLQLVLEADSEEESEFFELVGDFLLQIKQREIIKAKRF